MKLYYAPGTCSLADHIALIEAGFGVEHERVDTKLKMTASGADYRQINRKGYVPALLLDGGEILTENLAILDWIAQQDPQLAIGGPLGRTRLLEALSFLSMELHKPFRPFFTGGSEEDKAAAGRMLATRFQQLAENMQQHEYLLANHPTVADFYLLVMLLWADRFGLEMPEMLAQLRDRLLGRAAVAEALRAEAWAGPQQATAVKPQPGRAGT